MVGAPASNGTPRVVLVADADRDCANAVGMLLREVGVSPRIAYGGREAIALADERRPSSAVIDIAMPGVSGLDVARHLRARYSNHVRIVAYTAWTTFEDRQHAAAAGFEQVVAKDADPLELLSALSAPMSMTVERGIEGSRNQLRLQLDLAEGLIKQAWLTADPGFTSRKLGVLGQMLDSIDKSLGRLPLGSDERVQFASSVARLRQRLGSPPRA